MARARKYSKQDVNDTLHASEGRLSPVSNEPGHTLGLHVAKSGLQISDRLTGTLQSSATRPIVMDEFGKIRPEPEHRDIWRALSGSTTKELKNDYRNLIDNFKTRSGAFIDLQQAIIVGRYVLNSGDAQDQLAMLDNGSKDRVPVNVSMNRLESIDGAWKMNFAEQNNDITHLEEFKSVFMLIDKLPQDSIHIQTFFPIK